MRSLNNKFRLVLGLTFLLCLACAPLSQARSLWNAGGGASLFTDHKAAGPGDLVTIIIVEQAQATQNATTSAEKAGSIGLGPGLGILRNVLPEITGSGGDKVSASGKTSRGGSLNAKVTVKVVEVLENGNFLLEGRQEIMINGEKQEIKLTGIVRPQDIMADNTVLSTFVADANIVYLGDGPIGDRQTPGILSRLFHWLI
ncbi:MAG: flagellar basal body L-ring protein FlgH [Firmicutes bacterium]|nr:flagellar basal body L-ring protein FlgH [Bacillota bacterium]